MKVKEGISDLKKGEHVISDLEKEEQIVSDLQRENLRLNELVQTDWLTGAYNRCATEKKIIELMQQNKGGVLFVLDGNHLKQINDRYGHTVGDCFLQEIVRILRHMVLKQDIVGRVGGDEFVVYMPSKQNMDFALERSRQFEERLQKIRIDCIKGAKLSVAVGASIYEEGDDYKSLFDRADQRLIMAKHNRKEEKSKLEAIKKEPGEKVGLAIDMKRISDELTEQELISGAFCQDYEMFKTVYRFVERRLRRTKSSSYLILFTLTNAECGFLPLLEREHEMNLLSQVIQTTLRLGDMFTQYSSCQFLIMVPDCAEKEANIIAMRTHDLFCNANYAHKSHLLLHHCYPMKPARRKTKEG
ncbi:MAG: GGDEF domain-containing protein [Anaerovorax sp.]